MGAVRAIFCFVVTFLVFAQLSVLPTLNILFETPEVNDAPEFFHHENITPLKSQSKPNNLNILSKKNETLMVSKTKIISFCDYNFRSIAVKWYERLTKLGYDTHVIVATDQELVDFLESRHSNFRYEVSFPPPMPKQYQNKAESKQSQVRYQLLLALRWKFILEELKKGIHIQLTDADNIYNQYISLKDEIEDKDPTIDVWFAYGAKFPPQVYEIQGFTVCGGMSWWRASQASIQFVESLLDECGIKCDDQRKLNTLLVSPTLNMKWQWTEEIRNSRIQNHTSFEGIPTIGILGFSNVTGIKAKVWDRHFATRGLLTDPCPKNNWVSMPIVPARSRFTKWKDKLASFDTWDELCGVQN